MPEYKFFLTRIIPYKYRKVQNIWQNKGFLWPLYSCIRTKSKILSLYGNTRIRENLYYSIFYADFVLIRNYAGQRKPVFLAYFTQSIKKLEQSLWRFFHCLYFWLCAGVCLQDFAVDFWLFCQIPKMDLFSEIVKS